jgi:hypothetical protein
VPAARKNAARARYWARKEKSDTVLPLPRKHRNAPCARWPK